MMRIQGFSVPALLGALLLLIVGAGCAPSAEITGKEDVPEAFQANPRPVAEVDVQTLEIGAAAPDFRLPGADGRFHELADFDDSEVLAIIFTCNHCPTAQAYEERIKALVTDYKDRSVAVVAISPNSPLGLLLEELGYSDMGDTYEDNQTRAADHGFNFPYLYDGDNQQVSIQYGPAATPHAFVFDAERKLRYVGRLDGSEKPGTANAEDLRQAIDAILSGNQVENPVTKSFGCSTKWAWKLEWKEKVNREWGELPVTLEDIETPSDQCLGNVVWTLCNRVS
jgi:peroxiredoxin